MRRNTLSLLTSMFVLSGLLACGEDPQGRPPDFWSSLSETGDSFGADEAGTSESSTSGTDEGGGTDDTGEPSGTDDAGDGDGDPDADEGDACVSVSEGADVLQVPSDIIFVVDNSGSMTEEAMLVQNEMNGFSAQIQMSG